MSKRCNWLFDEQAIKNRLDIQMTISRRKEEHERAMIEKANMETIVNLKAQAVKAGGYVIEDTIVEPTPGGEEVLNSLNNPVAIESWDDDYEYQNMERYYDCENQGYDTNEQRHSGYYPEHVGHSYDVREQQNQYNQRDDYHVHGNIEMNENNMEMEDDNI